jgi:putative chitinase
MLTLEQLYKILPGNGCTEQWYQALVQLLPEYNIDTPQREAAFLAQCIHESGSFQAIKENLNYKATSLQKVFPKYFPTPELAEAYAKQPEKIANRVYANRMGNGSEESGDGYRYCGRGLIQLTGKSNYQAFADSMEGQLEDVTDYLATFEGAVQSACWFWETNDLNELADIGDIKAMTKKINGGYIGLEDRIQHYEHVLGVLCGH